MAPDNSIPLPPVAKLLLHIAALSLRVKVQEGEIAELQARLAKVEAEHAK
jgi:hypothetical protein